MTIVTNRFVSLCQTLPRGPLSPNNFLITDQEKVKLLENYQLGGVSNLERGGAKLATLSLCHYKGEEIQLRQNKYSGTE